MSSKLGNIYMQRFGKGSIILMLSHYVSGQQLKSTFRVNNSRAHFHDEFALDD